MPKKKPSKLVNSKARFDYDLKDSYTAGLVLTGAEVRSIRDGHVSMRGAFVTFKNDEAWLNNMELGVSAVNAKDLPPEQRSAPRKLLLKTSELASLKKAKDSGLTVVPTKLLPGRYIKIEISTARGKKKYDKRASLKEKQASREAAKQIKRLG